MAMPTLTMPPFPPLQWNECVWAGNVTLPSWAGCQSRGGAYGSVSSDAESNGSVQLTVAPEDEDARTPPLPEQARAFQWLIDHEPAIAASVLRSLLAAYPGWRNSYGYDDEVAAELMPEIDGAEQLRALIGLSNVHILSIARDGIAYIGFQF